MSFPEAEISSPMEAQQVTPKGGGPRIINVGSRNSQLALIQTNLVIDQLNKYYENNPSHLSELGEAFQDGVQFNIVSMTTSGDQILDKALPDIGSKSLFTKELEVALIGKRVDFVVHSLKDLPTTLPAGCVIGAITKRDDPNDVIVLRKSLRSSVAPLDLLFGTGECSKMAPIRIGTSSQRRIAMLKRCNRRLDCINIRGNLNTRLAKLDNDSADYDAIVLAKAGLERMKWSDRISSLLSPQTDRRLNDWCYAVGQGAMAVECRHDDNQTLDLIAPIVDLRTTLEAAAERSLMKKLEGGCSVPLGVRTVWSGENPRRMSLSSIVLSLDGTEVVKESGEVILSRGQEYNIKPRSELINLTTGIVLSTRQAQMNLIECSELGWKVADKMINSGCLRLMRPNKSG